MDQQILQELDEKIRSLVEALWAKGVPTSSSCEGHLDRSRPYPAVTLWSYQSPWSGESSFNNLVKLLGEWNIHGEDHRYSWVLVPGTLRGRTWFYLRPQETNPHKEAEILRKLQAGVQELASFMSKSVQ